jgi:hypothetical protein
MRLEYRLPFGNCHEFIEANWEHVLTNREEHAIREGHGAVPVDRLADRNRSYTWK